MGYVTLTAGVYAGMQQNALRLRSRLLGNLIVVCRVCLPRHRYWIGLPTASPILLLLTEPYWPSASLRYSLRFFTCMSCAMEGSSPTRAALCSMTFAGYPGSSRDSSCGRLISSLRGSRVPQARSSLKLDSDPRHTRSSALACPKACQAQKRPNSNKQKTHSLADHYPSSCYTLSTQEDKARRLLQANLFTFNGLE